MLYHLSLYMYKQKIQINSIMQNCFYKIIMTRDEYNCTASINWPSIHHTWQHSHFSDKTSTSDHMLTHANTYSKLWSMSEIRQCKFRPVVWIALHAFPYQQVSLQLLQIKLPKQSKAPSSPAFEWCLLTETLHQNAKVSFLNKPNTNIFLSRHWIHLYVNFDGPNAAVVPAREAGIEDKEEEGAEALIFAWLTNTATVSSRNIN